MDERTHQAGKLVDRLRRNAKHGFVGRSRECSLFREAIDGREPPFAILHVTGPGGIGKTTLLHALRASAETAHVRVGMVDGREIDASPLAFEGAVCRALGFHPLRPGRLQDRFVLMVDALETLSPLTAWLMRSFVPALPSGALLVVASRAGRLEGLSSEPGWEGLVRTIRLRNLDPAESRQFLDMRCVDPGMHDTIIGMSHGYPLALAIAADTLAQNGSLGDSERREIIGVLLDRLIEGVPTAEHRMVLELSAHVRVTSEAMIADAISPTQAEELFGWLKGLSFIEAGSEGLLPHDLAREVIHSDLLWRNPARLRALHARARVHYLGLYRDGTQVEKLRALRDLVYLHRLNPIMRAFFEFRAIGHVYAEPATGADYSGILAMVEKHEGPVAAAAARHWMSRRPEAFVAMRSAEQPLAGFLCHLDLTEMDAHDAAVDPVAREALTTLESVGLREGETASLDRFLMAADSYQSPSPVMTALQIQSYLYWMTTPRLSWALLALDGDTPWDDLMKYIDFAPVGKEIAELLPRRFILYGHDWRRVSPAAWFEMMEEREIETEMRPEDLRRPEIELVVLSETQFRDAVRDALRHIRNDSSLAANPLLRSRLLMSGSEPAKPDDLRQTILTAIQSLKAVPKQEKFLRALDVTLLQPTPSQEIAAERLGLPFGTYRYQFTMAIGRVADLLWAQELSAGD
ncbi:MAG: ATP-binding protein [Hyphomicrobiaceae bacterium]